MFDNTLYQTGVWDNSGYNELLALAYYRGAPNNGVCVQDRFNPQDYVGTQQPGCGVASTNGADPHYPNMPWGSVPIYVWGNTINAPLWVGLVGFSFPNTDGQFIQKDRDYFVGVPKPGYTDTPTRTR